MVTLQPMTAADFQRFLQTAITNYAAEKVRAGNWTEEDSLQHAAEDFDNLLPDREQTKDHYLYTIVNEPGDQVGIIWLARQTADKGFIYDILIEDAYRGKGYGKAAMQQIEKEAKQLGMQKIGLHVFGHNKVAVHLYDSLHYQATNIVMEKEL
ncbi:GNAT family N-acetyltransferase [Gracilibacillus caseinilyticus]|uniref:GNAT family N-acetyltransferase n=1 Tax=Gracilibacillus caseinilyticus TaxID=2932256 RepID=A0ABY4F5W5_9BACI|nr:GNAT family N-acetyltransferase [Gracilibacillus caseinilyticus]UOQ49841.1 GNAT family N-acetyltransferase [Gracilibacillus caseinilyticus]